MPSADTTGYSSGSCVFIKDSVTIMATRYDSVRSYYTDDRVCPAADFIVPAVINDGRLMDWAMDAVAVYARSSIVKVRVFSDVRICEIMGSLL